MSKFALLAEKLRSDGFELLAPDPIDRAALCRVHDPDFVDRLLACRMTPAEQRAFGLPLTPEVIARARLSVGGTLLTARLALAQGIACNTAGGSHHAHRDQALGFCTFNDVAVAAQVLLDEGRVRQAAVIDLDVHQGDGTARLFVGRPEVQTFSAHAANNYPADKARSDVDLPLPDGMTDSAYLAALLPALRGFLDQCQPELIFYNAGVDVHASDRLGRLSLSDAGITAREDAVLGEALQRGIPIAVVIGGGYAHDVAALAARHSLVHHSAARLFRGL